MRALWPQRPDGSPMTLGEMPTAQRRAVSRAAIRRVGAELQRAAPAIGAMLQTIDAIDRAKHGGSR